MSLKLIVRSFIGLGVVLCASICPGAMITVNTFNNNTPATVSANNGSESTSFPTLLTQFNVTFTPDSPGTPVTFDTFCVDLFHFVTLGQTYDVTPRIDLATAFTNGSRMAAIYESFGTADLSGNADQAAAVQIAVWDLSLSNHNPTNFGLDGDGTYSSGDENIFSIDLGSNPDAGTIAGLVDTYLAGSVGASIPGAWLDAAAAGDALNRGQSMLVPPALTTDFPEPASLSLLIVGAGGLLARRRRA